MWLTCFTISITAFTLSIGNTVALLRRKHHVRNTPAK
jgi:hypothetical protein